MSNLIAKITQTTIEINGKLHFSQIRDGETSLNFTQCLKKVNVFQMKIFEKITLLLFIIYSVIERKVLVILRTGPLDNENTLHDIDHISIRLNRLIMWL